MPDDEEKKNIYDCISKMEFCKEKNKEIKSEMNKFLRKLQKKKSITQILKWNFSDDILYQHQIIKDVKSALLPCFLIPKKTKYIMVKRSMQ